MDWKTKLVLPPNYVSLRHLKELREKEKADLELKIREEAEAEYRFRLEEEQRRTDEAMRLKEELEKRKIDEEKRRMEEEEKMKREREEEDRLRREIIRRDQILRTRELLCGESSRTRRNDLKKYSDDDDDGVNQVVGDKQKEEIKIEIVTEVIKDENLEEGKKKKKKKWGKKKKKKDYEKEETLELESQGENETLKSSEEDKTIPPNMKPNGFKARRQRNFEAKKIERNQKVEVEEIERKIGDLNVNSVDNKMKMVKKSKDCEKEAVGSESQTLKSETKSIEIEDEKVITSDTKPNRFKNRRERKLEAKREIGDRQIEMNQKVEEEIEKQIGDLNVNNNVDDKKKKMMMRKPKAEKLHFQQPQMSYTDKYPKSQIKNFSKHGKHIDSAMNLRNASGSSLVWVAKTDEN